jgi:hypothetical protein
MSQRHIQWLHEELPTLVSRGVLATEAAMRVRQYYIMSESAGRARWKRGGQLTGVFPSRFDATVPT